MHFGDEQVITIAHSIVVFAAVMAVFEPAEDEDVESRKTDLGIDGAVEMERQLGFGYSLHVRFIFLYRT